MARGHDASARDGMLRLAAEAIMRRLDDAVARLDDEFTAAHSEVDWQAMTTARNIGADPSGRYVAWWDYLSTRLPVDAQAIDASQDAWWWRPLPGPPDGGTSRRCSSRTAPWRGS